MSEVYMPTTVEVMTAWVEMRCGYDSDTTRREARAEFNVGFPGWRTARGIVRGVAFPLVEVEIVDKEEAK